MSPRAVAVAVSGGRDSMALLHCTVHAAAAQGVPVRALHVHHGLQAEANEWADLVQRICRRWQSRGFDVTADVRRLEGRPGRGVSVEAWARAGRYAALADMAKAAGCAVVLLAHHREDQAETFLLQALRGGGSAGLAAMPARVERNGLTWCRPWLDRPRFEIEAYVRRHRIRHADDPSNADPRFARNRLRAQVMPTLRAAFPDVDAGLVAAARRAARERALIDEVAATDLATLVGPGGLALGRWAALSAARRHEALRAWLAANGAIAVSEAFLEQLTEALPRPGPARWPLGAAELRRYRGMLTLAPAPAAVTPDVPWPCDARLGRIGSHEVPGCEARLKVRVTRGSGVPRELLSGSRWVPRPGAMQFQAGPGRPPRSLKKQFQAAGVPAWCRNAPILLAADGRLLFVPGLGMDARAVTDRGGPRVTLSWLAEHR